MTTHPLSTFRRVGVRAIAATVAALLTAPAIGLAPSAHAGPVSNPPVWCRGAAPPDSTAPWVSLSSGDPAGGGCGDASILDSLLGGDRSGFVGAINELETSASSSLDFAGGYAQGVPNIQSAASAAGPGQPRNPAGLGFCADWSSGATDRGSHTAPGAVPEANWQLGVVPGPGDATSGPDSTQGYTGTVEGPANFVVSHFGHPSAWNVDPAWGMTTSTSVAAPNMLTSYPDDRLTFGGVTYSHEQRIAAAHLAMRRIIGQSDAAGWGGWGVISPATGSSAIEVDVVELANKMADVAFAYYRNPAGLAITLARSGSNVTATVRNGAGQAMPGVKVAVVAGTPTNVTVTPTGTLSGNGSSGVTGTWGGSFAAVYGISATVDPDDSFDLRTQLLTGAYTNAAGQVVFTAPLPASGAWDFEVFAEAPVGDIDLWSAATGAQFNIAAAAVATTSARRAISGTVVARSVSTRAATAEYVVAAGTPSVVVRDIVTIVGGVNEGFETTSGVFDRDAAALVAGASSVTRGSIGATGTRTFTANPVTLPIDVDGGNYEFAESTRFAGGDNVLGTADDVIIARNPAALPVVAERFVVRVEADPLTVETEAQAGPFYVAPGGTASVSDSFVATGTPNAGFSLAIEPRLIGTTTPVAPAQTITGTFDAAGVASGTVGPFLVPVGVEFVESITDFGDDAASAVDDRTLVRDNVANPVLAEQPEIVEVDAEMHLRKQVSVDGGATWHDAQTSAAPTHADGAAPETHDAGLFDDGTAASTYPVVLDGTEATYRYIAFAHTANTCLVRVSDIVITDDKLAGPFVLDAAGDVDADGFLAAGESVTFTAPTPVVVSAGDDITNIASLPALPVYPTVDLPAVSGLSTTARTDPARVAAPSIATSASGPGGSQTAALGDEIVDIVDYSGLIAGSSYTASLMWMCAETGLPTTLVASAEFVAAATGSGSVGVGPVTVSDAEASCGSLVAFERVADTDTGTVVGVHEDLTDAAQTVTVPQPVITTVAHAAGSTAKQVYPGGRVSDTVSAAGLIVGRSYTLSAEWRCAATGVVISSMGASAPFTASAVSQTVEVGPSTVPLLLACADGRLVAFETLTASGLTVATHHDITSVSQTITVRRPAYTSRVVTATKTYLGGKLAAIQDTVTVTGAIPGQTVRISVRPYAVDMATNRRICTVAGPAVAANAVVGATGSVTVTLPAVNVDPVFSQRWEFIETVTFPGGYVVGRNCATSPRVVAETVELSRTRSSWWYTGTVPTTGTAQATGKISVPRLGLVNAPIANAVDTALGSSLGRGFHRNTSSDALCGAGNAVLAGHRTSNGAILKNIHLFVVGDRVTVTTSSGAACTYQLVSKQIVSVTDVAKQSLLLGSRPIATSDKALTIYSCTDARGTGSSASYRYVTTWRRV